jgi:hypothetical protein
MRDPGAKDAGFDVWVRQGVERNAISRDLVLPN